MGEAGVGEAGVSEAGAEAKAAGERGGAADARRRIEARARELGFDAVGFARADEPIDEDFARYEAFLDAGMHGTMDYLAEHREARRRLDGEAILAGARSVICLARRYHRGGEGEGEGVVGSIARYARGRDYHTFLRRRLRQLAAFVRGLGPGVEARAVVDTAPVLERAWAARAGLGFVGKNGLLIVPGQGSYALLGEVVTTLALPAGVPMRERCGACTRCLDACPTGAFVRPFVLDARRCVSYLSIEHRGPVDEALRPAMGGHLFGCDACQEACPFNATRPAPASSTEPFAPLPKWRALGPESLLELEPGVWDELAASSPVKRAGEAGIVRNALTVLANGGRAAACAPAIERLRDTHPDAAVREHAAWALSRGGERRGDGPAPGPAEGAPGERGDAEEAGS
ncbi:MAG TPA: tRNA epoxyqueuosine(34) reductase QueG [Polyangiaceae bacterium]|nr:tRNA epoxyqueuosine(34) reductase QueG [Polyangiaceae bacterium]